MTDDLPQAFLRHWPDLRDTDTIAPILGGELKEVMRIDAGRQSYVLRIYPPDVSTADVASELALTRPFAERMPEVPPAIATEHGEPLATERGRTAVLTTFIHGGRPDPRNNAHRRAAAETLARLHGIAASIDGARPRDGYPPYRALDWHANRWWSWPEVDRYLRAAGHPHAHRLLERVTDELAALPGELASLVGRNLPSMPVHNDYYAGNLIVRDGRIAGVTDWDECTADWRALEVANAACEFARDEEEYRLDPSLIPAFIDEYRHAGGGLLDREVESLRTLRHLRLLWETLYELGRACRGAAPGWPYLWDNLTSVDAIARLY